MTVPISNRKKPEMTVPISLLGVIDILLYYIRKIIIT